MPWHVPFHRVEAAAAAAKARSGSSPLQHASSESSAPGALSGNASSTAMEQSKRPESRQAGVDDSWACRGAGEHSQGKMAAMVWMQRLRQAGQRSGMCFLMGV